jgi:2'-5' RNA ligase
VDRPKTARLFLAGTVPAEFLRDLWDQLASVRSVCPQVHWAAPETLHLTLVCLGSVSLARIEELTHDLGAVAHHHRPLALEVTGMETFGAHRAPHVLAASLGGEVSGLQALVDAAREAVERSVPLEPTRPFRPHLTVARSRGQGGDPLLARCRTAVGGSISGGFRLERMVLYRSQTLPSGVVHTPIQTWTLGA